MGLIILGVIILIIALAGAKSNSPVYRFKGLLITVSVIMIIIGVVSSAIRQIDPGHVGVQVLFGKVEPEVLYEGINLVNPLIDVQEMTVQTQNYTMSSTYEEGQQAGDDAVRVLSKDGLEVVIDLTVLYKVMPVKAPEIYRMIGLDFEAKIIRPQTRTRIREVAVFYNATDLYTEQREEFESRITKLIEKDFKNRGIIMEQLLVRKIKLPKSVEESIERKITAVQDAQRMKYVLQKEKQEAQRKRVEAQGNADAQRIVAQALTDKVLQFEYIKVQKELAKSPNAKIILMGSSKNTPPIFIGK